MSYVDFRIAYVKLLVYFLVSLGSLLHAEFWNSPVPVSYLGVKSPSNGLLETRRLCGHQA